jgi:hypothetical protein
MLLTPSTIWGTFFFTISIYILLIYSSSLYFVSFLAENNLSRSSVNSKFLFQDASTILLFLLFFVCYQFLLTWTWSGSTLVSGFGHLTFTGFERKITLLILALFLLYFLILNSSFFFFNSMAYDMIIVLNQLTYWLSFLFYVSNILSLSFVIEVLTGLIMLLLIVSYNSATFNSPNELNYTNRFFSPTLSTTYFVSLLTFFWVSLLTTLVLFLFLVTIYIKFLTIEWSLIDLLSNYFITTATFMDLANISFSWSLILLCVFLKCAITPFYLWKPTFFKGIPFPTLFYYIFVFYFVIFLYFIYMLLGLFTEILFFNSFVLIATIVISMLILPGILYETLNLKAFLAVSSIMNSVILLLVLLNFTMVTNSPFL